MANGKIKNERRRRSWLLCRSSGNTASGQKTHKLFSPCPSYVQETLQFLNRGGSFKFHSTFSKAGGCVWAISFFIQFNFFESSFWLSPYLSARGALPLGVPILLHGVQRKLSGFTISDTSWKALMYLKRALTSFETSSFQRISRYISGSSQNIVFPHCHILSSVDIKTDFKVQNVYYWSMLVRWMGRSNTGERKKF